MTEKAKIFGEIIKEVQLIVDKNVPINDKLKEICLLLDKKISYYNWTGFYLVDKDDENMLRLSEYVGKETEHTKISFGQGICGQAAESKNTFIVQDVSNEENYLACSIETKSEIVVPIFKNNKIVGELDIDSHTRGPFSEEDKIYLERICKIIGEKLF
jgi:GAF domain-containing protein